LAHPQSFLIKALLREKQPSYLSNQRSHQELRGHEAMPGLPNKTDQSKFCDTSPNLQVTIPLGAQTDLSIYCEPPSHFP
jgi:hypothetical protein